MRTASVTTRTCMLPLVIGGVSTRFFAGFACFLSLTGDRSNLYPPHESRSRACGHLLSLNDKTLGVIWKRTRLERDYVLARERPRHGHLIRVDDEDFEHLVDVVISRRVLEIDPVALLQHVQIPERQPAVGARKP